MGFDDCWERVRGETPLKKQNQLAEFLDIKPTSVSGAKSRDTFPTDWAFKVGQKYNLNTDWILTGEGEKSSLPVVLKDQKSKYRKGEKNLENRVPSMGESEQPPTDGNQAHVDLDYILSMGNTYQRGAAKGYLSELSAEISEQIRRGEDEKGA